jgi:ABC-2 type transport system ATP-binding protein
METSHDLVISTQGLTKQYKGVAALDHVSLHVPRHSIFGFLGPNGAGKSTTIKLLLGLTRPTAGTATIFGLDSVCDSLAIRERVGYLAQDPRFYDHMTARETLRFAAGFFRFEAAVVEARINETLALVGLKDKADRPVRGFSGGERQRLGIAQAQINAPDLLILDEPAAALDSMGRRDVLEVMERLRDHTTIFYSTHILDDVQRVSDRVAILSHGSLVAQAPITELLAGSEGTVYTLTLVGNVTAVAARIAAAPWVTAVTSGAEAPGDSTIIEVRVRDTAAAEAQLLPLVLEGGQAAVLAFGHKQHSLENVFVDLVDGGKQHGYA